MARGFNGSTLGVFKPLPGTQGGKGLFTLNEFNVGLVAPDLIYQFQVDYLVVAGGAGPGNGGFANYNRGAGGAGGLKSSLEPSGSGSVTQPTLTLDTITSYNVTIGAGGAVNANGSNSLFHNITALGGGHGGTTTSGSSGGSGGGGGASAVSQFSGGSGQSDQGHTGGSGNLSNINSGGGGGAGANGTTSDGGVGVATSIIDTNIATQYAVGEVSGGSVYFSGGGAGAPGVGGLGGGVDYSTTPSAAPDNTGGGGAGNYSGSTNTSYGGSGVVILRYPEARSLAIGSGLTGTADISYNGYRVAIFTAGSGTVSWS